MTCFLLKNCTLYTQPNHPEYETLYSGNDFLWSFFPQYEGKAVIDVNPGSYFPFSTKPQMSKRSFDQMQAQLINKLHAHLTLEPKKLIQLALLPQIPHL